MEPLEELLKDELDLISVCYPEIEVSLDDLNRTVKMTGLTMSVDTFRLGLEKIFKDKKYSVAASGWQPDITDYDFDVEFFIPFGYPDKPLPMMLIAAPWSELSEWAESLRQIENELTTNFEMDSQNQLYMAILSITQSIPFELVYPIMLIEVERYIHMTLNKKIRDVIDQEANPTVLEVPKAVDRSKIQKEHAAGSISKSILNDISIYHGEVMVYLKNIFQSHFAEVSNEDEVADVTFTLHSIPSISRACHNMVAYRLNDINGTLDGHESDGEKNAGTRLTHLFQESEVIPNTMVVVTRWFGGLLGPARFRCIKRSAQTVLEEHNRMIRSKSQPKKQELALAKGAQNAKDKQNNKEQQERRVAKRNGLRLPLSPSGDQANPTEVLNQMDILIKQTLKDPRQNTIEHLDQAMGRIIKTYRIAWSQSDDAMRIAYVRRLRQFRGIYEDRIRNQLIVINNKYGDAAMDEMFVGGYFTSTE